jgi:membrane associated rhomboid family serine protease
VLSSLIRSPLLLVSIHNIQAANDAPYGFQAGSDPVYAAYRLSTYPLIHQNVIHAILNILALTPLMERFESEYGTLTTLALFFGREKPETSDNRKNLAKDR